MHIKMLRYVLLAALSMLTWSTGFAGIVEQHGRLQTKDANIVDQQGRAVSLAGMSLFWSQWQGKYYTADVVDWLVKDWKLSVIRVAVGVEHGGYLENPEREMAKTKAVIDAALHNDIYVIIDWHDHKAEEHTEQSVEFFSQIAEAYGTHPNIIYEIYNEPLQVSWKDVIKPYAAEVITAIRKHDSDNLIIVGTPQWSQRVDVVSESPIADNNVAYSLHFYAGTHKQWLRDAAKKAINAGVPIVVTEWGTVNANGDGAIDFESVNEWMSFIREHSLTHLNWAVSDKQEGASVLSPGASPMGHWPDSHLTDSGRLLRSLIKDWNN